MAVKDLHIGDVPGKWASGELIAPEERCRIALLRLAGCTCELPLPGYNPDSLMAPRCRACNTRVFLDEPTAEHAQARKRTHHLANKETMRLHPDLRQFESFADLNACYPGCGCEGE